MFPPTRQKSNTCNLQYLSSPRVVSRLGVSAALASQPVKLASPYLLRGGQSAPPRRRKGDGCYSRVAMALIWTALGASAPGQCCQFGSGARWPSEDFSPSRTPSASISSR